VIEVESVNTIGDAARQLAGYQKPVYVAGADAKATKKALQQYEGTTIGVIGSSGKTLKRSTRGQKK
jgi:sulfur relay (sulfurtransferase) DsrF/TusC family protein